jgi:hypothetical protein
MERAYEQQWESQELFLVEISEAAEFRFGTRMDPRTLRTMVAEASRDLLERPVHITDFLGALTINQMSRALAQ